MPQSTAPARRKITLSLVNSLPANATVWDADLRGFCARRQAGPGVSYLVKMRVQGQIRWFTIGRHGMPTPDGLTWAPDTARRQAICIMANPQAFEKAKPEPETEPNTTPDPNLFETVADRFLATHGAKKKPRTTEEYTRLVRLHLKPAFKGRPIAEISRTDVDTAHQGWSATPRAANHALAVLSKLMTWAEENELRPEGTNPCKKVQRFPERRRETFLQTDQMAKLGEVLDQVERSGLVGIYPIAAIRLLIYTGARLNEILTLQWSFIDYERAMIFLPDSKTGAKPIPLPLAAAEVLRALPRAHNNPYVIVGERPGACLVNLQKPWQKIRALSGLHLVRLHDLRHTWASWSIKAGGTLPVIGKAMGHANPQTTDRYAHLADESLQKLSQSTAGMLSQALSKRTKDAA